MYYLYKNLVALGIEPEISGSVARNSDHSTIEAVHTQKHIVLVGKIKRKRTSR
jgi:hypothetical protein